MMVPFQLSTLPVTPWKNGGGETREIICVPAPDAPFLWRASIATLQADGPFSPFLASTESLLCWRGSRYGCVARISTNRWRSGSRGLSPANGRCPASGSLRGLDFNIMTQRGRASATVQVVSDLQCPASEGVAYVLQGEWDLAGRRCAAGSGLCWRGGSPRNLRPVGSNGRLLLAEIALK